MGTPHEGNRATGWTTDVPHLIHDAYPDGVDGVEPPGQAHVRAWIAQEMRRRLRMDRHTPLTGRTGNGAGGLHYSGLPAPVRRLGRT